MVTETIFRDVLTTIQTPPHKFAIMQAKASFRCASAAPCSGPMPHIRSHRHPPRAEAEGAADHITVLNGSFNWTRGAVLSKHENVCTPRPAVPPPTPSHHRARRRCRLSSSATSNILRLLKLVISRRVPVAVATFSQRFEHLWRLFAPNS
jgi:hypothetical protein